MTFDEDDVWVLRIARYRAEEPIPTVLAQINKPRFVLDNTIETELKGYFIFSQKAEDKPRSIRGPADLEVALQVFEEVQMIKDRVCEILMISQRISKDLERLWDVARVHIVLKPEVASAKSDAVRLAVVARTVPELEDIMSKVKTNVTSSELLVKNLNKTYDIMAAQVDTIKQMMYWRNLALPNAGEKPTSLKFER
jgi:RNAse (barnase) inhibitor barstar